MAHDMMLDDSHKPSCTHPASIVVPAALASAEKVKCSGKDLILAVLVGYGIECRSSLALDPLRQLDLNFHPSCVCGCFAAAAVSGKIMSLSMDKLINSLGLAGCQASGLLAWQTEVDHMK